MLNVIYQVALRVCVFSGGCCHRMLAAEGRALLTTHTQYKHEYLLINDVAYQVAKE